MSVLGERRPVEAAERGAGTPWRSRWWGWYAAVAVAPTVTLLGYVLVADRRGRFQLLNDDAYYYLGVARSLARGHGSTFTGLTETNGYHPLWQLLLVPLAWAIRDIDLLIVGVVVVQGVIWALAVAQAWGIARRLGAEVAGLVGVVAMGVIAVVTFRVSFDGMETGLLLVVLVAVLRLGIEAGDDPAPRTDLVLGLLLAVAFLTRLDAVFVTGPLAVVLLRRGAPDAAGLRRRLVALVGPTAGALVVYVSVNQALFGTPVPVSGRAKSLGAPHVNGRPIVDVLQAGDLLGRPAWLGAVSLLMVGTAWALGHWRRDPGRRRLMHLTLAVAAGQAVFVAYLTFATSYGTLPWYHYNTALLLLCGGLLLADWLLAHVPARAAARGAGVALGALAGGSFLVVQAAGTFLTSDNTHTGGVAAGELARTELPDDAVLAMGDRAGIFGVVADRPLLQLEGLMADAPFLHDLERGRVLERMKAEGVDFYVRYAPRRERRLDGRDCWRLREPRVSRGPSFHVTVCRDDLVYRKAEGAEELTIWRFDP